MAHKMSNIHPDAKIGANVEIDAFVTIAADVEIGEGTTIGPNAVILDGSRIGKNCKISAGAVISGIPQDLKYEGEETLVEIGDNTSIREFVTINKGTKAKGKTVVGSNCLIQSYGHVAHDCILKNNIIIGSYTGVAGEVEVDNFAIISPGVLVHQFVKIGKHVIIQGGSKVIKDVPPYVTAGRDPLCYAGLNSVGLRRRGFPNEKIYHIQDIYRAIYQQGLNNRDAVQYILENIEASEERSEVLDFIEDSKRGIIKGLQD